MSTVENTARSLDPGRPIGVGQLSLVEHALCPLDSVRSLRGGSVYESEYLYSDTEESPQSAMRAASLLKHWLHTGLITEVQYS